MYTTNNCVCVCMQKSFHYIGLLKHVMRLSMTSLKASDAKEVASSVTAIANEKLKAEKEAAAGKKKTGAVLAIPILFYEISNPLFFINYYNRGKEETAAGG